LVRFYLINDINTPLLSTPSILALHTYNIQHIAQKYNKLLLLRQVL
ncbi:hypothetical protein M153_23930002093, partial [Pseudoloma neurophilia]